VTIQGADQAAAAQVRAVVRAAAAQIRAVVGAAAAQIRAVVGMERRCVPTQGPQRSPRLPEIRGAGHAACGRNFHAEQVLGATRFGRQRGVWRH